MERHREKRRRLLSSIVPLSLSVCDQEPAAATAGALPTVHMSMIADSDSMIMKSSSSSGPGHGLQLVQLYRKPRRIVLSKQRTNVAARTSKPNRTHVHGIAQCHDIAHCQAHVQQLQLQAGSAPQHAQPQPHCQPARYLSDSAMPYAFPDLYPTSRPAPVSVTDPASLSAIQLLTSVTALDLLSNAAHASQHKDPEILKEEEEEEDSEEEESEDESPEEVRRRVVRQEVAAFEHKLYLDSLPPPPPPLVRLVPVADNVMYLRAHDHDQSAPAPVHARTRKQLRFGRTPARNFNYVEIDHVN